MIAGEPTQAFASPGEALAHFGVKGMRWGVRRERETSDREKKVQELDLGRGDSSLALKKTHKLTADTSNEGYVDIRSDKGMSSYGKQMHQEMINGFNELRNEYPAVAAMKAEVAPMSHVPGGLPLRVQKVAAVVLPMQKQGDVRIIYNDRMSGYSPSEKALVIKGMPGVKYPGYTGRHEMGHVLAAAGGLLPPMVSSKGKSAAQQISEAQAYNDRKEVLHKEAFKKHGLSFEELSKLGPYASTKPSEAFAELYGHYTQPELRSKMNPDLAVRAQRLFDDLGGRKR